VGEVIHGHLGGSWQLGDDLDPDEDDVPTGDVSPLAIPLVLGNGATVWPLERVGKRILNGPEDGIAGYAAALGLAVGPPPQSGRRRRFPRFNRR
jgi:hypothetical protein